MDRIISTSLVLLLSLISTEIQAGKKKTTQSKFDATVELAYRDAQREYYRKNYREAIPLLKSYLKKTKSHRNKEERFFWVIDQIGTYYLRVEKNPNAAIKFLNQYSDDRRLTDAQQDNVSEWVSAAKEWKKGTVKKPGKVKTPEKLFQLGRAYFQKGEKASKYPADSRGNAYFGIAASYLLPFVVNNDDHKRIGEALFMMGKIRSRLWTDSGYWSENFFLKETIRRFPHTSLAWQAWLTLKEDVHLGYSGSGGDNTSPSLIRMLERYRKLAKPKKKA